MLVHLEEILGEEKCDFILTGLVTGSWMPQDGQREVTALLTKLPTHNSLCIRSRVYLSDLIVIQDAHIFLWDVPHNHGYEHLNRSTYITSFSCTLT